MNVKSICSYCAVGCGLEIRLAGGKIVGVEGDKDYPVNRGRLCSKGRMLHRTVYGDNRALHPMMRAGKNGALNQTSWEAAYAASTEKFAAILRDHGPDAVAFYVSGQLLTEDYYVFNKLMKGFIGSNNIDSNSRLCMSSAVAGYKRAFGVDGPPGNYDDIEEAQAVFLFGANPAFAHPILFRRLEEAKEKNPDKKVVVVDPRRTDSCSLADLHLQIKPGTDVALLLGMLNVLLWENLVDEAYVEANTRGFDEAIEHAKNMTPAKAGRICGLDPGDIVRAAVWFGEGRTTSMWTMGFNQAVDGVDRNNALLNLHLATGQIGKPGAGPFSLTGQPNAMGGREAGGLANLLPGHRDLASEADRRTVEEIWQSKPIQPSPGAAAVELFERLREGKIKAVWIAGTNPVVSLPNASLVKEALSAAEWVMVSDAYLPTETTEYADVVFPAAGWGEKDGTMTNAERRIARVRRAVAPPGEAMPDWWIVSGFARRLADRLGEDWGKRFAYPAAEAVFDEHRAMLSGTDCSIDAVSYGALEAEGSARWPKDSVRSTDRLYTGGKFPTDDGRARFIPTPYAESPRQTSEAFPYVLTTGRYRDQWHTMTKTGRVAQLNGGDVRAVLEIHPDDAKDIGLDQDELARIRSPYGEALFPVYLTEDVRRGLVFLPMHYGGLFQKAGEPNTLIGSEVDPVSKQPAFKQMPVSVTQAGMGMRAVLYFYGNHLPAVRAVMQSYSYASATVIGDPLLTRLEIAHEEAASLTAAERFDARFADLLEDAQSMTFGDECEGQFRRLWIHRRKIIAVRTLSRGGTPECPMSLVGVHERDIEKGAVAWLYGGPTAAHSVDQGRQLCACMNVGESVITQLIAEGAGTVQALQDGCGAGTGCGSCIPRMKRMLQVV